MKRVKRSKRRKRLESLYLKFYLDSKKKEHELTVENKSIHKSANFSQLFWKRLWLTVSKISLLFQIIKEVIDACSNLWF